ncbi:hypothetical protein ACA910_003936 [Epithemia clementina (nom. ined.)]
MTRETATTTKRRINTKSLATATTVLVFWILMVTLLALVGVPTILEEMVGAALASYDPTLSDSGDSSSSSSSSLRLFAIQGRPDRRGRRLPGGAAYGDISEEDAMAAAVVVGGLILLLCLCCCCCRRWSLWDLVACVCLYELCCDDRVGEAMDDGSGFILC